jgi:hypothetical protein
VIISTNGSPNLSVNPVGPGGMTTGFAGSENFDIITY